MVINKRFKQFGLAESEKCVEDRLGFSNLGVNAALVFSKVLISEE